MTTVISDYMNDPVSHPFSRQFTRINELLVTGEEQLLIQDLTSCVDTFCEKTTEQLENIGNAQ